MADELPSHFIDLVQDALLKSFWRRKTLVAFLRRHGISSAFIATWDQSETKREFIQRLIPAVESDKAAPNVLKSMAVSLADQDAFPDLKGWEDSEHKVSAAAESVEALRVYLNRKREEADKQRAAEDARKTAQKHQKMVIARQESLQSLQERLERLAARIGEQAAGYEFQTWFYDLATYFEITCRRPYNVEGRQIDGSVTVDGTTYLTELKFTGEQASVTDVDSFLAKVNDKADNTMGIMVSISGYSGIAKKQASGRKTPLLLMDHGHLYLILSGGWTLQDVIGRLRRHASQTAEAYLAVAAFQD